jgi:hypothetical protein
MVICLDMLCTIRILSHFITNPAEVYWNALKRVIKYLYTTKDLWLKFGGQDQTLEGYTDADCASQPHRHFISDYAFIWGDRVVMWSSKKQPIVALSATEAEYIAATHASKEIFGSKLFLVNLPLLSRTQPPFIVTTTPPLICKKITNFMHVQNILISIFTLFAKLLKMGSFLSNTSLWRIILLTSSPNHYHDRSLSTLSSFLDFFWFEGECQISKHNLKYSQLYYLHSHLWYQYLLKMPTY